MKYRWAVRATVVLLASLLLLSACSSGGGPAIDATRGWLQSLADLNFEQVMASDVRQPESAH